MLYEDGEKGDKMACEIINEIDVWVKNSISHKSDNSISVPPDSILYRAKQRFISYLFFYLRNFFNYLLLLDYIIFNIIE